MRRLIAFAFVGVTIAAASLALTSIVVNVPDAQALQDNDEAVPPGNPVIGDDRLGDVEPENDTRYGLWAVLALCLIGAGLLLVRIERWERRRSDN